MKTKTLICCICVSLFLVASVSIADASDVDVAKQVATKDALSRDWNLSSYGSNYSPVSCGKIDISSVESAGNGLYTVKAKLTLTTTYMYGTTTYSYTTTQDVVYSVDSASGKVSNFVYAPNNQYSAVSVAVYPDREVKTMHYQTQSYSFDSTATVSLGSDGIRTKEVGSSVSKSFYGTTTYESVNTWERTYDADGKYPTKYTAAYESKTNGVVTSSSKQETLYGTLGRAIKYSSEYKSVYNNTTYVSTSSTTYDPATFKVVSTASASATYVNGKKTNESSYTYEYSNGIINRYVYRYASYDATGKETASSKQETVYGATGRVVKTTSESRTLSGTYTYVNSSETIYDPITYKVVSSGSSSATYVNNKLTAESSYKYKYTSGIISGYTYSSSRYDAAGNKIGYSSQEVKYSATGRILESRSDSNNIYGAVTYISSYYSVYNPTTYMIVSSGGTSAILVNDKMISRTAYAYKYNASGRVIEYTYIYSRFDANGIAVESTMTVTHYTDSGIIDKRDTTGNIFGINGITLATYVTNCVFDAAGALTAQNGAIDMKGINLTLKYDVANGYVTYTHVIDEYGNELQRFGGSYTRSPATIVTSYVKEVTDRVNAASFNLDFDGDGKLTEEGDYALMKWLTSGNPALLGYLTSAAKVKLDLNLDGKLTDDDVILFNRMISDVDKLIEFAKILNIGADPKFDLNGDSKVDAADLAIMDEALRFMVDINKDGVVDADDIASLEKTLDGSLDLDGDGIFDYNDYYYLNNERYKLGSTYTSFNDNTQINVYGGYYRITKNADGTLTMTDIYYGDTATSLSDGTIELDGVKYNITLAGAVITLKYAISQELAARLDINQDGVIDYKDMNALYSMYDWHVDVNQDGVVDNTDLEALKWSLETAGDVNGDGLIDGADYSALASLIEAASLISRDVNQDGVIDQADVDLAASNYVLAVKYATHLPADTFAVLDQNKDGAITVADGGLVAGEIAKIVEDIDKIKEFADLLNEDPVDINKDGVINIADIGAAKDGYTLALKYIAYVPAAIKTMLDRNGDGLVSDADVLAVSVEIEDYIKVIKEAREHVDNLVYDADEGWGDIEDYIELVEVAKLANGNFSVLVRVDNFDFKIEVQKYYDSFYVQSVDVTDATGNYPGKIEEALAALFNCDKDNVILNLDYWYGGFYNKTAGTVNWDGYVNVDGYWMYVSGIYGIGTLDPGIDAYILEPILAAKNDIMVYLHAAAEDIKITAMWYGYVQASAAGFKMQYSYDIEYDYNTGTYKMGDFKLKAVINNLGKDIYGAALTYLAGVLNVSRDNINISAYSVEADGTMKFVLKHNGNIYNVSVNIGTGEIIVPAPDQQAAKDRVIADALARDWNFNIEAGTYEGETYYRIQCDVVSIKSIADLGNGLYEVKADVTLKEAREYGYSYTRSVTYYVGIKANNITKFDYNYGEVTVEMLDLKEVVDLSDYWNESNYEVKLAIDGTRVKQTGETSGSYSWYDYYSGKTVTNTQTTTWERVFDVGGRFPVSFNSKYEYTVDGILRDITEKSIEYSGDGKMSMYSNHSKSYDENRQLSSEENKDVTWDEAGTIIDNAYKYAEYDSGWRTTYLNEWRYRYYSTGRTKSYMNHNIYEYSGRKSDYMHTVEYDETGYRMASEYLLNTVVKDGRTIEYQYKNAVYNASGSYTSLNENSYRLNDDGSYAYWMNHYVYTDWTGQKIDEYQSHNYDATGSLKSDSYQKSVHNRAGGLIENGSRYASYDDDGIVTYLSEWRNNYWDDGKSKTSYNHSISINSYSGERYESSSQAEYDESGWRRTSENSWSRTTKAGNTISYSSRNATFDGSGNYTYLYETSYTMNENFTYKSYMTHSIYIDYLGTKADDYQNRHYYDSGRIKDESRTRYVWNEDGTLIERSGKYANYDTAGAYTYLDDWQNVYFDNGNLERSMNHSINIDSYSGAKTDYYRTNEYESMTYTGGYEYSVMVREYVDKTVTKGSVVIEDWYKDARYDTDGSCTYLWESNRAKYDDGTDKSVMTHYIYSDYWSGQKTDDYSKKTYHANGTLSGENINKSVWNGAGTRIEYKYLYSTYDEDGTLTYLTEDRDLYWDNGNLKSEHNRYVYTDYYTGDKRDQSTDSTYNSSGVRSSYDESVSNYDAEGVLADSYTLNRDYNSSGSLTAMEGRVVVPSSDGTQASYRVVYDLNASGYITYTHVYDAQGQEMPELGGQYYIHPTNIINEIKESQNAEIEANEASGAVEPEAAAGAVAGDEDAYKVLDLKEQIDLQKQSTNGIPVYSEPKTGDEPLAQNSLAQ